MRREDLGRYQMLWDCPFCGTEKLLGLDHRHCPSCGSPQAADKRYYPPEGEEIAVEDHPYHGADRVCPACETPNAAIAHFCGSCGSPLDEAAAAARQADAGPTRPEPAPEAAPPPGRSGGSAGGRSKAGGCLVGCVALVFLALAVFCLLSMFWKREAAVTVTGHSWERTIEVEKLSEVSESAWKEDLPSGARDVRCRKEQQSTRRVQSGEECEVVRKDKGDGTYDKVKECKPTYDEEPVYGEKCSYEIEKWVTARTERAQGASTSDSIAWPQVRLAGSEREGQRSERYVVQFRLDDGETGTCSTSQQRWATLQVGSQWTAEVGVMSDKVDCDALRAR